MKKKINTFREYATRLDEIEGAFAGERRMQLAPGAKAPSGTQQEIDLDAEGGDVKTSAQNSSPVLELRKLMTDPKVARAIALLKSMGAERKSIEEDPATSRRLPKPTPQLR